MDMLAELLGPEGVFSLLFLAVLAAVVWAVVWGFRRVTKSRS